MYIPYLLTLLLLLVMSSVWSLPVPHPHQSQMTEMITDHSKRSVNLAMFVYLRQQTANERDHEQ